LRIIIIIIVLLVKVFFFQCTHLSMTSLSVLNTLIKMDNQV